MWSVGRCRGANDVGLIWKPPALEYILLSSSEARSRHTEKTSAGRAGLGRGRTWARKNGWALQQHLLPRMDMIRGHLPL